MENHTPITQLLQAYLRDQISHGDYQHLFEVLARLPDDEFEQAVLQAQAAVPASNSTNTFINYRVEQLFQRIQPALQPETPARVAPKPRFARYYAAAAIFIAALATAIYFYTGYKHQPDILPGYNQATLTLADGTKVALDSAQSGIIISNEHIKYSNGGSVPGVILSGVRGNEGKGAEGSLPTSLTLSTPKGGQYQIILPDGTKVWLNAASTLKYPSRFSGAEREVFLEGEAYFEVAKSEKHKAESQEAGAPFIVKSQNQEIVVLGTSFNVTAFADEKETKTTLVEGKVQVKSQNLKLKTYNVQLLAPKQQAVVKGDSLTVSTVNVNNELAWKNNKFSWEGKTFGQVATELARWYNLEVVYTNGIPDAAFAGGAYRNENLSVMLRMLKSDQIRYRIENGRKLIIENLNPQTEKPMK